MAILSYGELAKLGMGILDEALAKSASEHAEGKQLFLSYSSKDKQHLPRVIRFFKKFDASVYVDKEDAALPEHTTVETAAVLTENIVQIPRLVVLVSPESYTSRWVPWELGLAHGLKGLASVAVLPIGPSATDEEWSRREYLGLYPRIAKVSTKGDPEPRWMVQDPRDEQWWEMTNWLSDPLK